MKTELKRMLSSRYFWMAAFVMFLTLQGYSLITYFPIWFSQPPVPAEEIESALQLSLGGIFFGGMILMFPFCVALACTGTQVEDIRSCFLDWQLLRSNKHCYARRKLGSAFLTGALVTGGVFCLHTCLWHLIALPYDPVLYPRHEIGFWEQSFFSSWALVANGLPILAEITLGMAFSGGIWGVVSVTLALWMPDRVLAVVIPASIYKLWSGNLTYYLFGFRLPSPDTLFNDAQTFTGDVQCLGLYAVLFLTAICFYHRGLERRQRRA